MTEQVTQNDLAAMLMANPEPVTESTGATEEAHEVDESQTEEAYELEAETDGYEEDDEDGSESEEPVYYDVKVDGEDLQVTLEEALAGYQRDSDYRKKTMSVAESRKEVEAKAASIDAKLLELDSFIKREEDSTDWDALRRDDPGEYLKRKEDLEAVKAAAEVAKSERNTELEAQRQAVANSESQKLAEAMGGESWTTEQRSSDMAAATAYLEGMGVTIQEMNGITDHRLWRMIFDAAKAQGIKQTRTKVHEQVRTAPKSVKPGQRVPTSERKRTKALNKLKGSTKHNSTNNLAEYLMLSD